MRKSLNVPARQVSGCVFALEAQRPWRPSPQSQSPARRVRSNGWELGACCPQGDADVGRHAGIRGASPTRAAVALQTEEGTSSWALPVYPSHGTRCQEGEALLMLGRYPRQVEQI